MKKALTLLCMGLIIGSSMQASDWLRRLVDLNPGVIDSVSMITTHQNYADMSQSYMIHYHQPLQHDAPELGDLPLRAILTVRNDADFTQLMTQMYIGGYQLDSAWVEYPNYVFGQILKSSRAELADRYHGNLLVPEHRYFGESCPDNPWTSLGYCEAKEAAADFHALLEAMKKVFTGKWAISGVSKGGITTAMQHAFYPDDADCYVPYSGPFLGYSHDVRMQEYYMANGWNQELNQKMLQLQRQMTSSEDFFALFCMVNSINPDDISDHPEILCYFAEAISNVDFAPRAYYSREQVRQIFAANEDVLQQKGLDGYTPEMMLYMLLNSTIQIDQHYFDWYAMYFSHDETASNPSRVRSRLKDGVKLVYKRKLHCPVFGIDKESWNSNVLIPYYYQAMRELGYYDVRFDYYFDDPEDAHTVNEIWQSSYDNVLEANTNHLFGGVEYSSELFTFVRHQTSQAQKPILFIYGKDDTWTGAHMEDEYVNGDNVRLYILPEQNHMVAINNVTDIGLQNELWAFTDAIFDIPMGISTLHYDVPSQGRSYTLYGTEAGKGYRGIIVKKGKKVILSNSIPSHSSR